MMLYIVSYFTLYPKGERQNRQKERQTEKTFPAPLFQPFIYQFGVWCPHAPPPPHHHHLTGRLSTPTIHIYSVSGLTHAYHPCTPPPTHKHHHHITGRDWRRRRQRPGQGCYRHRIPRRRLCIVCHNPQRSRLRCRLLVRDGPLAAAGCVHIYMFTYIYECMCVHVSVCLSVCHVRSTKSLNLPPPQKNCKF